MTENDDEWRSRLSSEVGIGKREDPPGHDAHVIAWWRFHGRRAEPSAAQAMVERWRQRLWVPLQGDLRAHDPSRVCGEAAKRVAREAAADRYAALSDVREQLRTALADACPLPEGLIDIAAVIGLRLLAAPDEGSAIDDALWIFGPGEQRGSSINPQSVKGARITARKLARGKKDPRGTAPARGEVTRALRETAQETGVSEQQVNRDYRNHRRRAVAEIADEAMAELEKLVAAQRDENTPSK